MPVLSQGNYGCVVTPGLRNRNNPRSVITTANRDMYVSKLQDSESAENEYEVGSQLRDSILANNLDPLDFGIFPVEDKRCNFTKQDVSKEYPECAKLFRTNNICIINYLKYFSDLDSFKISKNLINNTFDITFLALEQIHMYGFVHMDIKSDNMCVMRHHVIGFVDWGLASNYKSVKTIESLQGLQRVVTTVDKIQYLRDRSLEHDFIKYYKVLFPRYHKNLLIEMVNDLLTTYAATTFRDNYIKAFKLIDFSCLLGVYYSFATSRGMTEAEVGEYMKIKILEYFNNHDLIMLSAIVIRRMNPSPPGSMTVSPQAPPQPVPNAIPFISPPTSSDDEDTVADIDELM